MKLFYKLISVVLALSGTPLQGAQADPVLRFGLLPAESAIPLVVAQEKGFFSAQGIEVALTMFNSPLDRNIALQTGRSDGAIADLMTVLAFRDAGAPVMAASDINEDFKVLASPGSGVTTLGGLAGQGVAVVPNFALEYIMDRIAQKAGISYQVVNIPSIPARFEALLASRVTGVVFTEPQAGMLAARGAKVVGGSRSSGLKAGVLLFTQAFLDGHPGLVKAFYRAYNQAVDYINATPAAAYASGLVKFGFPDAVAAYLGSGVRYFRAQAVTQSMFDDISSWCQTKGLVKKSWDLADVATGRFLP